MVNGIDSFKIDNDLFLVFPGGSNGHLAKSLPGVRSEMVDWDSDQGRRVIETAGVAALR
ncbi:hypothetical protein [Desulfosarcina widdelii]|uniref:hypothetical protein n=1 Tax=Desulfosarcina widdelii TaxID=947919 RepID=UPI0012D3131D|nr:hypothetical protein [Desulfosarcina widdelii]